MNSYLRMDGITKRYQGVLANDHVDLEVVSGEVHALLGENGAGKSTLMGILYGIVTPTSGTVVLDGRQVRITSPRVAIAHGIGMVHQHFMVIPALTVVENIVLGMDQYRRGLLDLEKASKEVMAFADEYGMRIDPRARVQDLSVGEQQRVEIVKSLIRGAKLLILDEPTSVLTPQETADLFRVIRRLASGGHSVIFISHKLHEVMEVSDRITVLRSGKAVGTVPASETSPSQLARMMVGRDVLFAVKKSGAKMGDPILQVENLTVSRRRGVRPLLGISLTIKSGEILGIAGIDGNGQAELIEAIAGMAKASNGSIRVRGVDITNKGPKQAYAAGISHVPGDRLAVGLVATMNIGENIALSQYARHPFRRGMFLNWGEIRRAAVRLMRDYDIRATSVRAVVSGLSGGNQQKVVLARELSRNPAVLLAMYPTRGLDVGATEFVHKELQKARDRGCAVLLVSNELEEILSLSDTIAVIFEGQIMGIVEATQAVVEDIGLMMAGTCRDRGGPPNDGNNGS